MQLIDDVCYRALVASDTRFDGLFYVGISTTSIYCRPVCPARRAKREHCTFFRSAAAAEREGYRPCLRCRPELAPSLSPFGNGRGLRAGMGAGIVARIRAGALNGSGNVEDLAHEFDVSSRQLRRIVQDEAGVSPVDLAQTCRLLLAKQLLTETRLPVERVAFASGFSSLRRFNHAFAEHYRMTPTSLRRENGSASSETGLRLRLAYRPPFDFAGLLAFMAPRAIAGVERVSRDRYERTVSIDGHHDQGGWLRVTTLAPKRDALQVELAPSLAPVVQTVLARLRDVFDLHARPDVIDAHLAECPRLAPLVTRHPGLRVPGAFDGFELAWRAVLGQQVSVKGATTLAGRFVAAFGEPLDAPTTELTHVTPTADRVAGASARRIAAIGLPGKRAESLRALARLVADDPTLLEPGRPAREVIERLEALPGVGPWTSSYVAMRALRWPDAFPEGDLGLKHALDTTNAKDIRAAAEPWRPWRAYAAMHLWTNLP